jgi:tetratricopeptide (TPR) repeat protein
MVDTQPTTTVAHATRPGGSRPWAALLAVALCLPAAARAEDRTVHGYPTGGLHHVVVSAHPSQGLEVGMPRNGWYAKGIALDLKGDYEASHRAYQKARDEFSAMLETHPRWEKLIRGWRLKATFQVETSRRLRSSYYPLWRLSGSRLINRTEALHHKWLACRAFLGRSDRRLRQRIIDLYHKVLTSDPNRSRARISLAAMYMEIGQRQRARAEFNRVRPYIRRGYERQLAYYYTVAGDRERAFTYLKRISLYSSSRSLALRSNLFDSLRGDPRFAKLIGEP